MPWWDWNSLFISVELKTVIYGFIFLLGLCIGSFLNVVALRLLNDTAFTHPPSHCPGCKTPLNWWENIPVLSYIFLKGECRTCHMGISLQYPLVELATAFLFVGCVWQFGFGLHTLFLWFFMANLMVITVTDWKEHSIYYLNSLTLIPAGLLLNLLGMVSLTGTPLQTGTSINFSFIHWDIPQPFLDALIAVLGIYLLFEIMILLSKAVFGTQGFGDGDTHLMMGIGAFLGWKALLITFLVGFAVQALVAIPVLVIQWFQNKDWVSLGGGVGIVLFGSLPIILSFNPVPPDLFLWGSIAGLILAMLSIVLILWRARQKQNFTYMPLGPALIAGALITLVAYQPIMAYLQP